MSNLFKMIEGFEGRKGLPTFEDVVGMNDLKATLSMAIIQPMKDPILFADMGIKPGGKFIFFGPPGTGKSYITLAIAGETNAAFFQMNPSNTWGNQDRVPEAEIARLFEMARAQRPSVINIDEVETLIVDRAQYEGHPWSQKVLNEMLIQLDDGRQKNDGILLIGSTNAPWSIDVAALRFGRFEQVIFVPPPDRESRKFFFQKKLGNRGLTETDIEDLAKKSAGYTFADLEGALKRCKVSFLHERIKNRISTTEGDFTVTKDQFLKELNNQPNSSLSWFHQFKKHADDLPRPMVEALSNYRHNSREK